MDKILLYDERYEKNTVFLKKHKRTQGSKI
jgi:hypothetical protein